MIIRDSNTEVEAAEATRPLHPSSSIPRDPATAARPLQLRAPSMPLRRTNRASPLAGSRSTTRTTSDGTISRRRRADRSGRRRVITHRAGMSSGATVLMNSTAATMHMTSTVTARMVAMAMEEEATITDRAGAGATLMVIMTPTVATEARRRRRRRAARVACSSVPPEVLPSVRSAEP